MSNKIYRGHDFMELSNREITEDGYLVAKNSKLARTGVQTYRAYELGLDAEGMDPMRVIRLHRPDEEVFHPESMRSFESKPITIEHPSEAVTAENWQELAKGEARDVTRLGDMMVATLIVKSKDAIEAIQGGKTQLSNGYTFELDMTPGTTHQGMAYDGIQRNIRGNHVAIVDAARCGSACRIADSNPNQGATTMADALRKVIVDGIPLEVSDTAAAAIDKLQTQLKTAQDSLSEATAQLATKAEVKIGDATILVIGDTKVANDALAKLVTDHQAEVELLKKDVITPDARDAMVADWAALLDSAKRLVPGFDHAGKTCHQIRREVIGAVTGKDAIAKGVADAVLAGKALDSADVETLRSTFNALVAAVQTGDSQTNANDSALANALVGGADSKNKPVTAKLGGRDAFMQRMASASCGSQQ